MNVHFPRHASTIAEIKNKAEEERANLRSTVGARLERARETRVRASGGERERPSLHGDTNAANDVSDEINNDNDNNDGDDGDDETLGENEVEELMTFVNAAAASPATLHLRPSTRTIRNISTTASAASTGLKMLKSLAWKKICALSLANAKNGTEKPLFSNALIPKTLGALKLRRQNRVATGA